MSLFDPLIWEDEDGELRRNSLFDPLVWKDDHPRQNPSVWDAQPSLDMSQEPPIAQVPAPIIRKLARTRATPLGISAPADIFVQATQRLFGNWAATNNAFLKRVSRVQGRITAQPIGGVSDAAQQMTDPDVRQANTGHEAGHDVHLAYSREARQRLEAFLRSHKVSNTNIYRAIKRTYARRGGSAIFGEIFADMHMLNTIPLDALRRAAKTNERVSAWLTEFPRADQKSLYKQMVKILGGKPQTTRKKTRAKPKPPTLRAPRQRRAAPTPAPAPTRTRRPTTRRKRAEEDEELLGGCLCPTCRRKRAALGLKNPPADEGAGILYVWGDYVLLLLRSGAVGSHPYVWAPPGGRVEYGESLYEAALREAVEELGDLPPDGTAPYLDAHTYMSPHGHAFTTFIVDLTAWVPFEHLALWEPLLNEESDDWEWYPVEVALAEVDLHPGVREVLESLFYNAA